MYLPASTLPVFGVSSPFFSSLLVLSTTPVVSGIMSCAEGDALALHGRYPQHQLDPLLQSRDAAKSRIFFASQSSLLTMTRHAL